MVVWIHHPMLEIINGGGSQKGIVKRVYNIIPSSIYCIKTIENQVTKKPSKNSLL